MTFFLRKMSFFRLPDFGKYGPCSILPLSWQVLTNKKPQYFCRGGSRGDQEYFHGRKTFPQRR